MGNIFERLARITSANIEHFSRSIDDYIKKRRRPEWENGREGDRFSGFHKDAGKTASHSSGAKSHSDDTGRDDFKKNTPGKNYPHIPQQVVEDLAVFNLSPPSSFKAVKKARKREVKKYHSDKFMHDPEKLETSKQIMQIYNAAYDRLKTYYNGV